MKCMARKLVVSNFDGNLIDTEISFLNSSGWASSVWRDGTCNYVIAAESYTSTISRFFLYIIYILCNNFNVTIMHRNTPKHKVSKIYWKAFPNSHNRKNMFSSDSVKAFIHSWFCILLFFFVKVMTTLQNLA